jgi:hypothetical protein
MIYPTEREDNQATYVRLKMAIDRDYPKGQFVAILDGQIIADAPTFAELSARLRATGKDSPDVLVVEAGANYPDYVTILHLPLANDTTTD